jgi:hypothetical protein
MKVRRTESGSAVVKSHTGALAGSYPARIAHDHGDRLRDIDLNPVAVTADGELVVLDAAVYPDND